MGGSHTIVHRPVSNVYSVTLVANTASSPMQLVTNTNEQASFIYILNTGTAPVLVNLRNNANADALAFPASGSNARGFVVNANSFIVLAAPVPTCYVSALSTAVATVYFQLLLNQ